LALAEEVLLLDFDFGLGLWPFGLGFWLLRDVEEVCLLPFFDPLVRIRLEFFFSPVLFEVDSSESLSSSPSYFEI
jgi:hypothetical protein